MKLKRRIEEAKLFRAASEFTLVSFWYLNVNPPIYPDLFLSSLLLSPVTSTIGENVHLFLPFVLRLSRIFENKKEVEGE